MNLLMKTLFGSHVYGTSTPQSDTDYKAVYIPSPEEILMQTVRANLTLTSKVGSQKNSAEDVDLEVFSLAQYLKLVTEGQTVAVDMLFTPSSFYAEKPDYLWHEIIKNRDRLLSKQISGFVGYVKSQANKYGIKGSRVAAVRRMLEVLKRLDQNNRLAAHEEYLRMAFRNTEHVHFVYDHRDNLLLECCNRKVPMANYVKVGVEIFQRVFDEYGARALQAENNENVDWKATMHAVRIATQAVELLSTGHITFPRPEAPLLLKIRKGDLPYKQVAEMIESGLEQVEAASHKSTLRELPDFEYAKQLVFESHLTVVQNLVEDQYRQVEEDLLEQAHSRVW
jgi:predicted nucleotidyltransferase